MIDRCPSSFVPSAITCSFLSYRLQILNRSWYGESEKILTKFWKTKWPTNYKIEQNSLISWATESRFCMEVDINRSIFCMEVFMDNLNKFWKTKLPPNHKIEHNSLISWQNFEKQNGRQIAKLSITRSFLELQSPDLAWKFVGTVWTNFDKIWKNKMAAKKQNGPQITKLSWYELGRLLSSRVRFLYQYILLYSGKDVFEILHF